MKVKEIAEKLGLMPIAVADDTAEVRSGYAGDLLSWVMGRVPAEAAWITIMSNINVVAVAVLREVSMVIVAEGSDIPAEVAARAAEQGVNLYAAKADVYTLCAALSALLASV